MAHVQYGLWHHSYQKVGPEGANGHVPPDDGAVFHSADSAQEKSICHDLAYPCRSTGRIYAGRWCQPESAVAESLDDYPPTDHVCRIQFNRGSLCPGSERDDQT